jgi:hypothetical protein
VVKATNSKGAKGILLIQPMYKVGGGAWKKGKSFKLEVGKSSKVIFPGSKDSISVKVISRVINQEVSSQVENYFPDVSTILSRMNSAGKAKWSRDKVPYLGMGYGPDVIYLSSDSTGYCGVWIWQSSSHFEADYNLGVFPWNSNPYWAFTDKRSDFSIFATVSKRNSNCSQSIKKAFGLK